MQRKSNATEQLIMIDSKNGKIRITSYVFSLYIVLLPIAAGLSGIIGNISLLNYIALLYIVMMIVSLVYSSKIVFRKKVKYAYFYLFYTLFSCIWNQYFTVDWYFTTFLTTVLLFTLACNKEYSESELKLFKRSVKFSIIIVFAAAAANISSALTFRLYVTISSTIDPNDFACGLCVIIGLLLTELLEKREKWIIIPLLGLFGVILLSGSRGAMLMVLGMLAYWIYISVKNKQLMILFVALIICACAFVFFEDHISQYLLGRISISTVLDDGGSGRIKIWAAALGTFKNSNVFHMIFGYGHGGFKTAVNYIAIGHSSAYEAHNIFINALIEGGIIGVTLLILAFFQVFRYAASNMNTWGCLSVIGFIMEGLTLDAQSYRVFALALIIAVINNGANNNERRLSATNLNNSTSI